MKLLLGLTVAMALALFVACKEKSSPPPRLGSPANSITNTTGTVTLASFTSPDTHRWQSVPRGTQVCDSVTFICEGAVRTAGWNATRMGNRYPGAVLGVPVQRRGTRIHFLHAGENATDMNEGAPYARIVLHYASGTSKKMELLFGVHGDDWLQGKRQSADPVADPNSRLAWLHRRAGDGTILRLYHTMLANPLPEETIVSVDFISALTEANLLLFGLTIDDDARPLAPTYGTTESIDDHPSAAVMFVLQDASGQLPVGATLRWSAHTPSLGIDFPPFAADTQGEITLDVPRRLVRRIHFEATASNGATNSGDIFADATGSFPAKSVVKLIPSSRSQLPNF